MRGGKRKRDEGNQWDGPSMRANVQSVKQAQTMRCVNNIGG